MKLHYSKILLFSLALNILAHSKNELYITSHTITTTSRVLSECDLYMPKYDNDADIKSVKENFDRQTSRRFEEYEERMKGKRQKRKEERDKNIQEIIEKDRMDKSLADKVEKGCLRCGCGLGGVAAGVGIIGPIAVKGLENAAVLSAAQKGIAKGIDKAIEGLGNIYELNLFSYSYWSAKINGTNFSNKNILINIVNEIYNKCTESAAAGKTLFCKATLAMGEESNILPVKTISEMAAEAAEVAGKVSKTTEEAGIALANTASYNSYVAIAYSIIAILIILLVMVIIYLTLRYRRKKRMNKKIQYTKLLNQ
ncbi:rifin [Plasmodium falciparum IGH-CR14]|uniref:Rifin n=1 Tax=Plasmodium falciparum IGH-CR14 TaxID=580059 RepID=A0A0L1IEX3_PLAFA|nr:rifin [Plasmodium falciparum IGH-CR14]